MTFSAPPLKIDLKNAFQLACVMKTKVCAPPIWLFNTILALNAFVSISLVWALIRGTSRWEHPYRSLAILAVITCVFYVKRKQRLAQLAEEKKESH